MLGKPRKCHKQKKILSVELSLKTLLGHVKKMEEFNETFHFQFKKKGELLSNGAFYLCIKKAFTPFGAMHMLK